MTKRQFKAQVRSSVRESVAVLNSRMDSLLRSGVIDLETADLKTCKAATRAFLLDEADQFSPFRLDTIKSRADNRVVRNMQGAM